MTSRILGPRRSPSPPHRRGYYAEDGRSWIDVSRGRTYRLLQDADTLEIELEEAGGHTFWGSVVATLAAPPGHGLYRFVARAHSPDARWPAYAVVGGTFASPRSLPEGAIAPREEWAPDMVVRLAELREELSAEGWLLAGHGEQPWSYRYVRPRSLLDAEG